MKRSRRRSVEARVARRRQRVLDERAAGRHVERLSRAFGREVAPDGGASLAAALCNVAKPLVEQLELAGKSNEKNLDQLFVSVLAVWDLDLVVEDKVRRELNEDVRRASYSAWVDRLLERRRQLYPDDRRFVVSATVQMVDARGSFRLNVAALPCSPV